MRTPGRGLWLAAVALGLLAASALAQRLDDPTRPPPGFQGSGAPGQSGAGKLAQDLLVNDVHALVLQSVIISGAARSAIISGQHVAIGAKIGNARLVKVAENEVVLLTGSARRTLKLFPGVDKRKAARAPDTQ